MFKWGFVVILGLFIIAGCFKSEVKQEPASIASVSPTPTVIKEPEKPKPVDIESGSTIKTNTKEIKIKKVEFADKVEPDVPDMYYTSYTSKEGKVIIHIKADVKNLGKNSVQCDKLFSVDADYNNGYTYKGYVVVESGKGDFKDAIISDIDPLDTKSLRILINCPIEVKENKEAPLFLLFNVDENEYKLQMR